MAVNVTYFSVFCLILFAAVSSVEGANDTCPDNFVENDGSCYRIVGAFLNWFQAGQFCTFYRTEEYNAHLVTIETEGEQNFLQDLIMQNANYRQYSFWIGLNSIDRNRGWTWSGTGSRLAPAVAQEKGVMNPKFQLDGQIDTMASGFTSWAPGEPNRAGRCSIMWRDYSYRWADTSCYNFNGFPLICEINL